LTAEHLVKRQTRRGIVKLTWEPIPGRENHVLDCRVYARAAAAVVGMDRFQESDWIHLERFAGSVQPTVRTQPATNPPAAPSRSTPGKTQGWLGGGRGSWLKGR
jgi:phage terminase large subunit GpA-like protein